MNWRTLLFLLLCVSAIARGSTNEPGADIFATNAPVLRIQIDIARNDWRSLEHDARKPVPCVVREGGNTYQNVLVHIKGAAGSFRDINNGPALTLSFAKKDPTQRFHGLRKIHLNNSVQDRSFTTENIVGQMFRDAGVPTTRATNARFILNGRDLGFYVVKEGWTKEFLNMSFKSAKGNLYDGGFLHDIDGPLEKDSGDETKGQPDVAKLLAATRIPEPAIRWSELQKVLDTDRFLTFMAVEALSYDWDGYMANRNNYRLYHDPTNDKMVFLPHGLDQMFWEANASIYRPQVGGIVARAVFETPEGNKLYRERIREVFGKAYRLEVLTNRFDYLVKRNRQAVSELGRGALQEYDGNTAMVRDRIIRRWQSVKDQLENEPVPLRFDKGPVAIKGWHEQTEMGEARLTKGQVEGKEVLRISANDQCSASWRSSVMLEAGRYRFSAIARSAKLSPVRDQKGEGAGIRVSGTQQARRNKILGDSPWTKLEYEFDSRPGETVLVCESRANRGDVWFELDSLKLEKIR